MAINKKNYIYKWKSCRLGNSSIHIYTIEGSIATFVYWRASRNLKQMPHHIPHRFPQRELGSQIISNPGIFTTYWCLVGNGWEWENGMITTSDEMDHSRTFSAQNALKRTSFGRKFGQVSIWDERNPNTTAALAMMSPNSSMFLALLCLLLLPGSRERNKKSNKIHEIHWLLTAW